MIRDNLSGAKGTTQSSAIIWLSLDPSLRQWCPKAPPNCLHPGIPVSPLVTNHAGASAPPFSCPKHLSPRPNIHSISSFYTLETFTIIIIIIMQNHNFIIYIILHHVYCNLVEYCNIVYCGTIMYCTTSCELYYNLCEHH